MLYEKWKRYIWTLKTLHSNFENVNPNIENVTSELQLWKLYIITLKRYIRTKISQKLNKWTKKVDHSKWLKKNNCNSRAFFLKGKGADWEESTKKIFERDRKRYFTSTQDER